MRKQYDDDDGRTIVDMNVEGMPWYDSQIKKEKRKASVPPFRKRLTEGKH